MVNKGTFDRSKQSLDHFNDSLLAEFELIDLDNDKSPDRSHEEQQKFADFVKTALTGVLRKIADRQGRKWARLITAHPEKFKAPVGLALGDSAPSLNPEGALCPPGFHEEDGICVRSSAFKTT